MTNNYKFFYNNPKTREVVYEFQTSKLKRGKILVTRNCSFEDQFYCSKQEAQEFINNLVEAGYVEGEL